jgi:hypothetical protein
MLARAATLMFDRVFTSKCGRDKAELCVNRVAEKSFLAGVVTLLFLI